MTFPALDSGAFLKGETGEDSNPRNTGDWVVGAGSSPAVPEKRSGPAVWEQGLPPSLP